jgi:cation-transporting P-type ATPase E
VTRDGASVGALTNTTLSPEAQQPARGLSESEARRRLAERGPAKPPSSSRSYASIVRANVLTVFNVILLVFGVITLAFGAWQDALFLGILVANVGIGIAQEARAKRSLDRLAALVAPTATVVRDGQQRRVDVDQLVVDDLVQLAAGDQVVADGRLVRADGLMLDESILTGETEPVARTAGDEIRSGSFVAEGAGSSVVTAVGWDSYAVRIAGEAREFRHPRSPLERELNRLLFVLVAVMAPLGLILGYALWERDTPFNDSVTTSVAAVVTMVPEGLILLTSVTYAAAALQIARRGALAQQLNAIESLASVDVLCLDKTGTLTEPRLQVIELVPAPAAEPERLAAALGRFAASAAGANATLTAIRERLPAAGEPVDGQVPFSSRRRWSGLRLDNHGYILGAPEHFPLGSLAVRAETEARQGRRVLAFGTTETPFDGGETDDPPRPLTLLGLVVLSERLRPDAAETASFFLEQGVALKVISGDRMETVAAVAADAGIPGSDDPVDATTLPSGEAEMRDLARRASVVGRISPEGKRRMIEALRDDGSYVAMVGDGVNDVPALKAARLAVAQGSGTEMAKSVADLVLVRGEFSAVPKMVAEGRKIFRNLQRVAKLFVTKSVFAVFLILSAGLTPIAYPLLPRHLTLAAALTIGLPAFFLALAPSGGAFRVHGFLRDVAQFAVPAGTAAGLGVLSGYLFAYNVVNLPLVEARTVATTVLVAVGLYLILALEAAGRVRGPVVSALCAALGLLYVVILALPGTRGFFDLAGPSVLIFLIAAVGAGLALAGLWLTDERFVPGQKARPAGTD